MAPTLRQVATGTHIPNTLAASNTTTFSRTPHILKSTVAAIALVLPNWYVAGQTETNAGAATWTASIEYPAGTYKRVTFGGAASITASDGGNIVSDLIPVSIPKGEKFWVRLFQNAPNKAVYFTFYAGDGTAQFTSPATDMTMGGTVTTSASFQAATTTPIAIIGMSEDSAVGIYGDSISVGRGDTADAGLPLQGHLGRAFGANYATGHVGISGDRMSLFLNNKNKRMSLAQYFTHFALNMGINDITNGASSANVANDTNSIVALFPGPVALCTLSPVSTSTNSWTTVAAQTTHATNAVRVAENTRRLANTTNVKVVYDVNPAVESVASPASGVWAAPSFTADGTHPAVKGYKAEAAVIDPMLLLVEIDKTAPVMVGEINIENITSDGATLSCQPATDAKGVAGYEFSIDGGVNYVTIPNAGRLIVISGLPEITQFPVRMRAFDAANNRSEPLLASFTTLAIPDTTAPEMVGEIEVSNETLSGFDLAWQEATDEKGIAFYEVDDGSGEYVNVGNVLSLSVTGKEEASSYFVRIRALDLSGNPATPITVNATTKTATPIIETSIIVETGEGIENANSYVSIENARIYAANRGIVFPVDDAEVATMLIRAMDYLEAQALRYVGYPSSLSQPLQWPRTGVEIGCVAFPVNVIPRPLIFAQIQLAMAVNAGFDLQPTISPQDYVIREKTGPIETEYADPLIVGIVPTFTAVNALLAPLFGEQRASGFAIRTQRV